MIRRDDRLLRWRKEFPILARSTYLISNSLGAMPRSVSSAMKSYAETWAARGVQAWSDSWWDMSVSVGDSLAPLIGAGSREISMHPNCTLLQAMLISCFHFRGKRNRIVTTDMEFPSTLYVYEKLGRALGARLRLVHSPDGIHMDTDRLLRAIDERTLLVSVSHVLFRSSFIQDVRAISQKAHRVGAKVIVDAYHSVGCIPVDVRSLGADMLVGGVLKWLCGGPGGAFLWVRPELRRSLRPKITGWAAHTKPFAFDLSMDYAPGPERFLTGTPSIPSLYAAREGPRIITKIGAAAIRSKSRRQTALVVEEGRRQGVRIASPLNPEERAGTVTLDMPRAYEISRKLLERGFLVDYREGSGIRIAPHFYSTDEEVLSALEEIEKIVRTRAYRDVPRKRSIVT